MVLMMVDIGTMGHIIIGESEKNKGKKSQALPTKKKWGKNKSIIQTMNQQGKKPIIIIITMVRDV